ncbi:MAG: type II toxin-antitoxin system RelE/ParE family toxin [Patescibacteria group bacterium]
MKYILYHTRAIKFLRKIPKSEASRIIHKVNLLKTKSQWEALDIKKLQTTKSSYRLRVGAIRVVFEIILTQNTIYIQDIDFRGNIY